MHFYAELIQRSVLNGVKYGCCKNINKIIMIKIITQESLTPWKHNRKKRGVAQDFCTILLSIHISCLMLARKQKSFSL